MTMRLLQIHLEQGLLLLLGWLLLGAAWTVARRRGGSDVGRWRGVAVVVPGIALVLPLVSGLVSPPVRSRPPASPARTSALAVRPEASRAAWPVARVTLPSSALPVGAALALILASGTAIGTVRVFSSRRRLARHLASLPVARRVGRVTVAVSDAAAVPYAARAGGRAFVVVPTDLLADLRGLRTLVAHELQHHRQGDLHAVLFLDVLRAVFFWNPAAHAWARLLGELQEMACDEALLSRRRVAPPAYAALLLRVARFDRRPRFVPEGVTAAASPSVGILERRIAMVVNRSEAGRTSRGPVVAGLACLVALAVGAVSLRAAVGRPLEAADVEALAARLARRGVTVAVSPVVVEEVNGWVGSAKGRAFLREARARFEDQRPLVESIFERHHVPAALAAVAVVESGFRSLEARPGFHGAGVWQFIPATARRFGLEVGDARDERMTFERETTPPHAISG